MLARVMMLITLVVVVIVGILGYRLVAKNVEARVYRARLQELESDYGILRARYNEAVRATAVTELVVENGELRVSIRTAAGEIETIRTPYDPSNEIYVDFVVLDGRLWIRRIFDDRTPPAEGIAIDPALAEIEWPQRPDEQYGKAAYRQLSEGRWVVTVTGDGSLGLAPAGDRVELTAPPRVRRYEPLEAEIDDALRALEASEILAVFVQELSPGH